MSTTPPEETSPAGTTSTGGTTTTGGTGTGYSTGTGSAGSLFGSLPADARLPIPGNAEFVLYVVALVIAWLVCWLTDSLNANNWFTFFTVLTAVYILSRGIAKASRVLEQ